jgi:DNA-directed RNA polymerase I, II, and III subunit RPABC1
MNTTISQLLFDRKILPENTQIKVEENPKIGSLQIIYFQKQKVGVKELKCLQEYIDSNECSHLMLIYSGVLTTFSKQYILSIQPLIVVECFSEAELSFNVTHHELVPKHSLISSEEIETLINKYKISLVKLPRILKSDPISRYYGAQLGDVFQIMRKSETCGTSVYYRLVS